LHPYLRQSLINCIPIQRLGTRKRERIVIHKHKLQEISNPGRYEFLEIALDVNNK